MKDAAAQPFDPDRPVSKEEREEYLKDLIKGWKSKHESKEEIEKNIRYFRQMSGLDFGNIVTINAGELLKREFTKQDDIIEKGILPVGGSLIIAADAGIGKSIWSLEIAIHLAKGWNLYDLPVTKPRKVLIVQFENPQRTQDFRIKKMLQGFGLKSLDNNLSYLKAHLRFDLKLKGDRKRLLDEIMESKAEVVIYDPLSSLHSENENDNSKMRNILDTLTHINRQAETSCIIIHHFGKPNDSLGYGTNYRLRGATAIKDWADTAITLTRKPHSHKELLKVDFIKVRNGPRHSSFLLERDNEHFTHSITSEESLCSPEKVAEILEEKGGMITTKGAFVSAIQEEIECAQKTARKYLDNAIGKTIIEFKTGKQKRGYKTVLPG